MILPSQIIVSDPTYIKDPTLSVAVLINADDIKSYQKERSSPGLGQILGPIPHNTGFGFQYYTSQSYLPQGKYLMWECGNCVTNGNI